MREYPGDTIARVLADDDAAKDEPCPALDPETRTCDLYSCRPLTCRTFGPAMRFGDGPLEVCELCYQGAGEDEIAACEVAVDPENLERRLLEKLGDPRATTVAFAIAT